MNCSMGYRRLTNGPQPDGYAAVQRRNGVRAPARGEPLFTNVERVRQRGKDRPTLGRGLVVVR
jgi:hypothetical protein